MIPLNLIRPIIEATINTVIAAEAIFGRNNGPDKKREAVKEATKAFYNIIDGFINLSDEVDAWAELLIDRSVDSAVDYFNGKNKGDFTNDNPTKVNATNFVISALRSQEVIDA